MEINTNTVLTRAEEMMSQLEKSWPQVFDQIIKSNPCKGAEVFFIHTILKWNFEGELPKLNIYHQPRVSMPDPAWGHTVRKINKTTGVCEILWSLPIKEGQNNFEKNKIFQDPQVAQWIDAMKSGALKRMQKKYNQSRGF